MYMFTRKYLTSDKRRRRFASVLEAMTIRFKDDQVKKIRDMYFVVRFGGEEITFNKNELVRLEER